MGNVLSWIWEKMKFWCVTKALFLTFKIVGRKRIMCRRLFFLITALALCLMSSAYADLTHSYTFEDGTANDSVGEAHGTLVGGAVRASYKS